MKIAFGEFTLDWDRHQLLRSGSPVHLSPKGLDLLRILLESRPRAMSKTELHERIWPGTFISDATLTSLVAELRRCLEDKAARPRFVRTVHRFGYAFCGEARELGEAQAIEPRAASYWLTWDTGQAALRDGENILGRDRDATVWFDSVDVSRRHARISIAGGEAVLEDLASKNGTSLRGIPVSTPSRLANGDQIALGSVIVTFHASAADASTVTKAPETRAKQMLEAQRQSTHGRPGE
ncbi:MAG TPA: winged helix-turn-helix domain-containing protein [Vicinamibacterales bacterium]|nr:winged helix-turn-helix domain-containing protein [Vicinamibacterales bacterium]